MSKLNKPRLIKLTHAMGSTPAHYFFDKLPKKEIFKQENYNHYFFEQKLKMVHCLKQLFEKENDIFKKKVKSKKLKPMQKWHVDKDHIPVLSLLLTYFTFLKAYVESIVGFITLYLRDLQKRGLDTGEIYTRNKYDNLKRFYSNENLKRLNDIRNLSVHSHKIGDLSLAYEFMDNAELEICLIHLIFPNDGLPEEKSIWHTLDLNEIIYAAENILPEFKKYVDTLIKD